MPLNPSLRLCHPPGQTFNPFALSPPQVVGEGRCPVLDNWWQTETGGPMITPMPFAWGLKPGSATVSRIAINRSGPPEPHQLSIRAAASTSPPTHPTNQPINQPPITLPPSPPPASLPGGGPRPAGRPRQRDHRTGGGEGARRECCRLLGRKEDLSRRPLTVL